MLLMNMMSVEDWASVIGIFGAVVGGITWLVKVWIVNPMMGKIDILNSNFGTLNDALTRSQNEFEKLETRVNNHDVTLESHKEQLKTLFRKGENN